MLVVVDFFRTRFGLCGFVIPKLKAGTEPTLSHGHKLLIYFLCLRIYFLEPAL